MLVSRDDLEHIGARFRQAVEAYLGLYPEVKLGTNFVDPTRAHFPRDCCKATAFMLGHCLSKMVDPERLSYASGQRERATHGWLQVDGYIVDLTADQFVDEDRRVIVERVGESEWHNTFKPHRVDRFTLAPTHHFVRYADEIAVLM